MLNQLDGIWKLYIGGVFVYTSMEYYKLYIIKRIYQMYIVPIDHFIQFG